jgi:hypothetical protein
VALRVETGAGLPPLLIDQGTTDDDGMFHIGTAPKSPWGCAVLVVRPLSLGSYKVALDPRIVIEGGDLGDLLVPGHIPVTGRLAYPDGAVAAGWTVKASVYTSLGFVSDSALDPLAVSTATASTDEDGRFAFEALPPGLLRIEGRPDRTGTLQDLVYTRLLDAAVPHDFSLTVQKPCDQLVRFLSAGAPFRGNVQWLPIGAGLPDGAVTPNGPDSDGWWRFELVPGVRYDVVASAQGHRPVHLAFRGSTDPDPREVPVVAGTVSVRVQLEEPSEAEVLVGIVGTGSRSKRIPSLRLCPLSEDNIVAVGSPHAPLTAGKRALIMSTGGRYYWFSDPLTELDLQVGAPPIVLSRLNANVVTVKCTRLPGSHPVPGARVLVQRLLPEGGRVPSAWGPMTYTDSGPVLLGAPIATATTAADGSAEIPFLPEFDLQVCCQAIGYPEKVIGPHDSRGRDVIHVEMEAGARLTVEASDAAVTTWGRPALVALQSREFYQGEMLKSGEYILEGVPEGEYLLGPASILVAIRHLPGIASLSGISGVEYFTLDAGMEGVRASLRDPGKASYVRGELLGTSSTEGYLVECLPASSAHSVIAQKPVGVLPGGEFLIGPIPAGTYDIRVYMHQQIVQQLRVAVQPGLIYEASMRVDN